MIDPCDIFFLPFVGYHVAKLGCWNSNDMSILTGLENLDSACPVPFGLGVWAVPANLSNAVWVSVPNSWTLHHMVANTIHRASKIWSFWGPTLE